MRDNEDMLGCHQQLSHDSIAHSWIHTWPTFQPLLNKVHYFLRNSFIVACRSSDFGTSSSLASWPARVRMPFARSCIASWDSFWAWKCYKTNQSYYSDRTKKWPTLYATSIQFTTVWAAEFSYSKSDNVHTWEATPITPLMTWPNWRSIPAPVFAGPRRLKSGLNDRKLSAVFLICASRARRSLP